MDLYIVRHALAYEHDPMRWPDDRDRPLMAKGVRRFRRLVRLLRATTPAADVVLSSPLVRAWQTAEVLEDAGAWPAPQACAALEPGTPPDTALAALEPYLARDRVAVVGHEPDLHVLVGYLLTGSDNSDAVEMK